MTSNACTTVAKGGVGESGSSELLTYKVTAPIQKLIKLQQQDSSLCPNMGAVGVLLINGQLVAQGVIDHPSWSIQATANPGDQVVAILYLFPLFNSVLCARLGQLTATLEECDLVGLAGPNRGLRSNGLQGSRNWKAWNDKTPPTPDEFHIVGDVLVPNCGIEPKLVERVPQGIVSEVLLLDLIFIQKPGCWPTDTNTISIEQIRFDKVLVNSNYTSVEVYRDQILEAVVPVDTVS